MEAQEELIERRETGVRILFTILFCIVVQVLESVLLVVILFELIYTLVTQEQPTDRVRGFANRATAYFYRIGRYLTYNERQAPFPFAEFPAAVEPTGSAHEIEAEEQPT